MRPLRARKPPRIVPLARPNPDGVLYAATLTSMTVDNYMSEDKYFLRGGG